MTSKTAVIIQPCFFPWRGQLDLISRSDVTIFLDNVQYVKQHWYNRNKIAGANGNFWISVPVQKAPLNTLIKDTNINNRQNWKEKIKKSIYSSYSKAPYFETYFTEVCGILDSAENSLSDLSQATVRWSLKHLNKEPEFLVASDIPIVENDSIARLLKLCHETGANRYLSGPAARDYITDESLFSDAGIELEWMSYDYPRYSQIHETNEELSILDLLFNHGPESSEFIWDK